MKILFSSYTFAPNIGGIESVSAILAEAFAQAGHDVELITETPGERNPGPPDDAPLYHITRRPSFWELVRLLSSSDILFQNNISLRSLIPALLLGKRVIVVHQTWLLGDRGEIGWTNRVKRALLPRVTNIAMSQAILDHIRVPARVICDPYDEEVFRLRPAIPRDRNLVFLGRLVSDKGADLLLRALKILQSDGLTPGLTIIGLGPEEQNLQRLAEELGLDDQVTFVGARSGDELAGLLNRHRILVVPSRWAEPFGLVALEGIACGCAVVGSRDGGLKEAIGPCGLTFENGNEAALATCLKELLLHPEGLAAFQNDAPAHLAKYRTGAVVSAYLDLLKEVAP